MTIYCGVDFDARQQTVCYCDTADGVIRLAGPDHQADNVRVCYSSFTGGVIVGIEASGTAPGSSNSSRPSAIVSVCASGAAAFHRVEDFAPAGRIERAHERIANGCLRVKEGFASIGRNLKLCLCRPLGGQEVVETPHRNSITSRRARATLAG